MARLCRLSNEHIRRMNSTVLSYLHLLLLIALLVPTVVVADDSGLVPLPSTASDSFPACGLRCSALKQARDSCVPPGPSSSAPESDNNNNATYVTCFCRSDLLGKLRSSGDGTCDDVCTSGSDRSRLYNWYRSYCDLGGKGPAISSISVGPTTKAKINERSLDGVDAPAPRPWIKTHYGWVIMVVVLAVAFTAIGVGATWLKRRHDAKKPILYPVDYSSASGALKQDYEYSAPGTEAPDGPDPPRPDSSHNTMAYSKPHALTNAQPVGSRSFEIQEIQR